MGREAVPERVGWTVAPVCGMMPLDNVMANEHTRTSFLITAGPTHEPIDRVRYVGNRSSGRLGVALADEAARRGHDVRLLLGPCSATPVDSRVIIERFRTASDLQSMLRRSAASFGVVIMAAAVADYRPRTTDVEKIRRGDTDVALVLEPVPDLIAEVAARRGETDRPVLVAFALEPAASLRDAALGKLERKGVDAVVANPLATMESPKISATLFWRDGRAEAAPADLDKPAFACWLLDRVAPSHDG